MVFVLSLGLVASPVASAGDCTKRDTVDWHATMSAAFYVRNNCPSGDIIGTAPSGEKVEILEVDKHGDFYKIKTSVGTGFVYKTALKDIVKEPLGGKVEVFEDSIFKDLDPMNRFYSQIEDVKNRGIIAGYPDGTVGADNEVKRAELAKILVEATVEDENISGVIMPAGVYKDIGLNEWYAPYLKIALDKGVMTGDGGPEAGLRTVRPGDTAKGGEVAKMIAEAFGMDVREQKDGEQWYERYMEAIDEMKALPYVNADHMVTRGEMMYMVSEVLSFLENNESLSVEEITKISDDILNDEINAPGVDPESFYFGEAIYLHGVDGDIDIWDTFTQEKRNNLADVFAQVQTTRLDYSDGNSTVYLGPLRNCDDYDLAYGLILKYNLNMPNFLGHTSEENPQNLSPELLACDEDRFKFDS